MAELLPPIPNDLLPLIVQSTRTWAALSQCSRGLRDHLAGAIRWKSCGVISTCEYVQANVSESMDYRVEVYNHAYHITIHQLKFIARDDDMYAVKLTSHRNASIIVGDGVLFGKLSILTRVLREIFGNRAKFVTEMLGDIFICSNTDHKIGTITRNFPTNRNMLMRDFINFPPAVVISDSGQYVDEAKTPYQVSVSRDKITVVVANVTHELIPLTFPRTRKYVYIVSGVPMQSDSTISSIEIIEWLMDVKVCWRTS